MNNMKMKISKIQIARRLVQILGLILLPGSFILAFSGLKDLYLAILSGDFSFSQNIMQAAEVFAILPITIIFGRYFCGWLCAFGTFNDFIYAVSKRIIKIKYKVNEKLDSRLKYLKYFILGFIVFFIWTIGSTLFKAASPWDAFAQLPDFSSAITQYTLGTVILLLITAGAMFVERFFCRYLCPLGAVFQIASKIKVFNIAKKRDKCGNCRICTRNCSMGIPIYKFDKVRSGECINCFECLDACPRENTKLAVAGEYVSPVLATCVALGSFSVLYTGSDLVSASDGSAAISQNINSSKVAENTNTGAAASDSVNGKSTTGSTQTTGQSSSSSTQNASSSNSTSTTQSSSAATQKYKDGTYTGTGNGYRPGIQVSVTISSGKISDIQIGSNNETPRFANRPFSLIPAEIVEAQSTKVDGVSGATRTSNGIKQAVENALLKATQNS